MGGKYSRKCSREKSVVVRGQSFYSCCLFTLIVRPKQQDSGKERERDRQVERERDRQVSEIDRGKLFFNRPIDANALLPPAPETNKRCEN